MPFILSIFLAYILSPLVDKMSSRKIGNWKIPRGLSIIIIYIALITGLSFIGSYFFINLTNEMRTLVKDIPSYGKQITENWVPEISKRMESVIDLLPVKPKKVPDPVDLKQPNELEQLNNAPKKKPNDLVEYLDSTIFEIKQTKDGYKISPKPKPNQFSSEGSENRDLDINNIIDQSVNDFIDNLQEFIIGLLNFGQKAVFTVVGSLMTTLIILMITAFLVIDAEGIICFVKSLIPEQFQVIVDAFIEKLDTGLNGVVRGQLIICLVNGSLTGIGMLVLDIKFALTLSILATISSLIPIFGVIISSIPIILMALTNSIITAILALGWILGIHFIEGNFLNPKIMGKAAKIHPVLVIMALVAGEKTFGLAGALLAVPLFSILQTTYLFVMEQAFQFEVANKQKGHITKKSSSTRDCS